MAVICFFPGEHCHVVLREGNIGCGHSEQHTNKVNAWVVLGMDRWMCRASGEKSVVRLQTCPTWLSRGYIWGHNPHLDFLDARQTSASCEGHSKVIWQHWYTRKSLWWPHLVCSTCDSKLEKAGPSCSAGMPCRLWLNRAWSIGPGLVGGLRTKWEGYVITLTPVIWVSLCDWLVFCTTRPEMPRIVFTYSPCLGQRLSYKLSLNIVSV